MVNWYLCIETSIAETYWQTAIYSSLRSSSTFVNRILGLLRNTPMKGTVKLPQAFFKDIMWFQKFLKFFNGSIEIHPSVLAPELVYVDASLQRVGGIYGDRVYTCPIPYLIQNLCSI